jgi:hypothetical protein
VDDDSQRLAGRYFFEDGMVRLQADQGELRLPPESVIVLGVIVARLRFDDQQQAIEEPL